MSAEVECRDASNACTYPPAIAVCVFCPQCDKWVVTYASTTQTSFCLVHRRQQLTAPMGSLDVLNGRLDLGGAS